jgi:tetratricopeptide (TPR) repeat protein
MMKKYILILAAAAVTGGVSAQKNKVVSAYNYDKAFTRSGKCKELVSGVEAINMAIENDQTKSWAKTWYYRGNLYFNIIASKDSECKAIDVDALDKCTDSYLKALVLNFDDPELKKMDLQKEDGSDMIKFFGAMQNNPRMDDESYTSNIMGRKLPGLSGEYANQGITKFGNKDYKGAQQDFGKSMLLSQMTGRLDTMLMYNTALASEYAEDYETAKQVYDGLIMMKYNIDGAGPDLYKSMYKIYKKEGNNEKASEYISNGRKAYPEDNSLLVLELEGFLQSGNNDEALANLNAGITNDPSNSVLYFARGTVYENLKDKEKAVADYKKAIELNPDYYDACFNLGAYYFNSGADKINESNKLPLNETKKYDAFKAAAKKDFEDAVPYIESAHRINPGDGATGEMLINLYTQTGQYDKAKEIRAKFE